MDNDLPLFRWKPPCKVLLFPLVNRVGKVRRTARILSGKQGDDAANYWKQVTLASRRHLVRVGLTEKDVEAQLQSLSNAVHAELVRLSYADQGNGGAA